ncbi:SWI/SNF transcription activation complex subunit [Phytophthora cinnamomi]|uniref:SWI/SNF transcription activation complex subunit n=1 Tax=Phytophthora cinnamomi TaxID=4785 RepID=UPI0035598B24|nr:SWI/SNF transcription activation complex subunit [Phytophthora cinnamomi]
MQQPGTRLRCDPTDYAKRQQEKKDRAKELREQRQRGVFSDEHTFAPKVNPRARNPSPPASREEPDQASRSLSSDSMAYRNYGHNNNHQDTEDPTSYGNDALDNLSRRYPKKAPPTPQQMASLNVTPLEPEHDTLFREVKRATGREIEDLPIKKTLAPPRSGNHIGPCLRNSSCGCPKCAGGSLGPATTSNVHAVEAPIRRREQRAVPSTDSYRENNGRAMAAPNEMGNSLMLLKSKMSRRKARSAPTNQASLFVEKNTPSAVVHSARLPSSTMMSRDTPSPPPRQPAAPRRTPAQAAVPTPPTKRKMPLYNTSGEDSAGDMNYPPPISSGFNLSEELDEYADGAEEMEQCHNCNRKFNVVSFQKHQKVCAKVFSGQRKVFNMAAKRLEGTEAEKIAREAKAKNAGGGSRKTPLSATEQPIKVKSAADWKQKSEMFRNAMKASRDVSKALKEGKELPPVMPSAPDPSLIQFPARQYQSNGEESSSS